MKLQIRFFCLMIILLFGSFSLFSETQENIHIEKEREEDKVQENLRDKKRYEEELQERLREKKRIEKQREKRVQQQRQQYR